MFHDTYLDGSQYLDLTPLSDMASCLSQNFDPAPGNDSPPFVQATSGSLSSSRPAIGPISTVANKNERRKAQNRAAQRAFRIRQQQALSEANSRMRSMQEDLKEAHAMREHFQRLFEKLSVEHERLLSKVEDILGSAQARGTKS